MFKVEFYVDDPKLGPVLQLLAGSGVKNVTQTPITNVEVTKRGKLQPKSDGPTVFSRLTDHLHKNKIAKISYSEIQAWLEKNGSSRNSGGYVTAQLRDRGVLKYVATGRKADNHYLVVGPKK